MSNDNNHIKLRIPGESFWAIRVEGTTDQAIIDNLLLDDEYRYKDKVKFNPSTGEVIKLVERTMHQIPVKYFVAEGEDINDVWKKIATHFESHGIEIEGMVAGIAMLSVPKDMAYDKIKAVADEFDCINLAPEEYLS
jgi:hypothetical protein